MFMISFVLILFIGDIVSVPVLVERADAQNVSSTTPASPTTTVATVLNATVSAGAAKTNETISNGTIALSEKLNATGHYNLTAGNTSLTKVTNSSESVTGVPVANFSINKAPSPASPSKSTVTTMMNTAINPPHLSLINPIKADVENGKEDLDEECPHGFLQCLCDVVTEYMFPSKEDVEEQEEGDDLAYSIFGVFGK